MRQVFEITKNSQGTVVNASRYNRDSVIVVNDALNSGNDGIIVDSVQELIQIDASRLSAVGMSIQDTAITDGAVSGKIRVYFDTQGIACIEVYISSSLVASNGSPTRIYEEWPFNLAVNSAILADVDKKYAICKFCFGGMTHNMYLHVSRDSNGNYWYGISSYNEVGAVWGKFAANNYSIWGDINGFVAAYIPFSQGINYVLDTEVQNRIGDMYTLFVGR